MHHAFQIADREINVALSRARTGYRLHLGERIVPVDLRTGADGRAWLTLGDAHIEVVVATRGDDVFVHLDGEAHHLRYRHPLDRLAAAAAGHAEDQIRAPMPGSIVSVAVAPGDAVTQGQVLLVMESMKMETTITAPRDGVIATVNYQPGQTFDRDALLLSLEPMETCA
ncbi:Biotin-requiring enzyme [Fontimonas thermophila]|uniref:Biotin-requiring enzyme n=1 Tax=Fontimonas thermophila TaxID=1076937 RepID=A0A1I2HDE4_9GAMM|nr:acetyl-CoA carboxylase biotin carboxyl carrier protein subunit [Fontimonas thermophila]SFF26957.1 Biotin-requiring enzyme [Fontimonas thermophila]